MTEEMPRMSTWRLEGLTWLKPGGGKATGAPPCGGVGTTWRKLGVRAWHWTDEENEIQIKKANLRMPWNLAGRCGWRGATPQCWGRGWRQQAC